MIQITSLQNPIIKEIINLVEKPRYRRKKSSFVIEGVREINLALKGGYTIDKVLYQPQIISFEQVTNLFKNQKTTYFEVSSQVYEKIAYRGSTEGILGIAQAKSHRLDDIVFHKENPLVLIAESPEKPGNIGAILRTADAAGVDVVIIADLKTDLYNSNVIRSSVGCIFTTKIAISTTVDAIDFLKKNDFQIFCAALSASVQYQTVDFTGPSAIVVGTESTGLTKQWIEASTQNIIIPMSGYIDSMNVSVAAAVITFEAQRQRQFQK